MSRHVLLPLAVALASVPAPAQHRLAPETTQQDFVADYEADVRSVLREAFGPEVKARALVYPSFQPEFAVGLRQTAQQHEIFFIRPSRMVWTYTLVELMRRGRAGTMTFDGRDATAAEIARLTEGLPERPSDLPVERCATPVDEALAGALILAWRTMLEDIGPRRQAGLDGVTYEFSMTSGNRSLAGEIWSPERGTRSERLVRIANLMRSYCEAPRPRAAREMLSLARELVARARARR